MTTDMQPPQGWAPQPAPQQGWGAPVPQVGQPATDPWGQQQAGQYPSQQYQTQAPVQQAAPVQYQDQSQVAQNLPAVIQSGEVATLTATEVRDAGLDSGLDDLGIEELRTPRIKIIHPEGMFEDSTTGHRFPVLNAVVLGFVKQRIFWPRDVEDSGKDDQPHCKSNDFERGMPNTDTQSRRMFPWHEGNFNPNLVVADPNLNRVMLPCTTCSFKEWTGASKTDRKAPRCNEVWNLIVMYDPFQNGQLQPAFFALRKSAIKNLKAYLASFKQRGIPAYSVWTQITLERESRGQVIYSMPSFNAIAATRREDLQSYSENYRALADYAKTVRPLAGGAQTGVQQEFTGAEFNPTGQYQPQAGQIPPTVAEMQGHQSQQAPVYYPQPMPPQAYQQPQQQYQQAAPQYQQAAPQYQQAPQQAYQQPQDQQAFLQQLAAQTQNTPNVTHAMTPQQAQQAMPPTPVVPQSEMQQAVPTEAPASPVAATEPPQQAIPTSPPVIQTPPAPPVVQAPPAPPVIQTPPSIPAPVVPAVQAPPVIPVASTPPPAPPVQSSAAPAAPAPSWAGGGDQADDDEDLPF